MQIVVAVTPDLTGRIKAGQIVKELAPIVGGGGGGRPDFAEAGGKQPEKIDEMLARERAGVLRKAFVARDWVRIFDRIRSPTDPARLTEVPIRKPQIPLQFIARERR